MKRRYNRLASILLILGFAFSACSKDENEAVKNDVLRFQISPILVGEVLELSYGAGSPEADLQTLSVEASVAGAEGTRFDDHTYTMDRTGTVIKTLAASQVTTSGAQTTATLVEGNNALTLRYYYVVPEGVRGKNVSFAFTAKNARGVRADYRTPSFRISAMSMASKMAVANDGKCFFSLETMAFYTQEEVEAGNLSSRIDFVYRYQATAGESKYAFGHAIVALSNGEYTSGLNIPPGWSKNHSLIDKRVDVRDGQLKDDVNLEVYVDDIDLQKASLQDAADYAFGFGADQGAFIRSHDGKMAAYVYFNAVDNAGSAVISVKKLVLQ